MNECKPLHLGPAAALGAIAHTAPTEAKETVPKMKLNAGRRLHSFTSQLNLRLF